MRREFRRERADRRRQSHHPRRRPGGRRGHDHSPRPRIRRADHYGYRVLQQRQADCVSSYDTLVCYEVLVTPLYVTRLVTPLYVTSDTLACHEALVTPFVCHRLWWQPCVSVANTDILEYQFLSFVKRLFQKKIPALTTFISVARDGAMQVANVVRMFAYEVKVPRL